MTKPIRTILLVEENPGDAGRLREILDAERLPDTNLIHVSGMSEAEAYLAGQPVDIVVLDLALSNAKGSGTVRRARLAAPHALLVVLNGPGDEPLVARTQHDGAQDYLVKDRNDPHARSQGLLRALRRAVESKGLEEPVLAERERAEVTFSSIADAVICTDVSDNITFLNAVAERLTGWTRCAAVGRPVTDVFRIADACRCDMLPSRAAQGRSDELPLSRTLVRGDGTVISIEDRTAPTHDRNGRVTGTVVVFRDVSAARAMTEQIARAAQLDYLTGLPNRTLLHDRIGQAIARSARHKSKFGLLFLGLDGFKYVNKSLGHPMGDKLLKSIAERLTGSARASDTVSRQGGDEFVVLLSELNGPEDAAALARRMLKAVAGTHSVDQHDLHVTMSIGVSIYPDDGEDAETLIKNADTAMFQAKENGRHSFQLFRPAMNTRAVERQSIEEGLQYALKREELKLQYQPKIDLKTGAITGAEALLRWVRPGTGLVSPGRFIPVAEACGLILPIGAWVLREACAQARLLLDRGLHFSTMAVNVSAIEFQDDNFLHGVFGSLEETGLDPEYLELELTESVLMKHVDSTAAILRILRDRGVKVTIDDFGTGYSSLSYLRKFPVNALKIDQSFVRQIGAGEVETAIVTAIIGMARALKLKVVAEGVETLEELEFLRAHQCDEAQGFYFGRSLPPARFAELLRTGIPEITSPPTAPSSNPERSGSCMPGGASRQSPGTLLGAADTNQ